ncbi:MAG TPA: hypothetical protein VGT77_10090 [Sphingomonas sp.]|jgi:hypothetical protein|nr:hypothetical protein [Sphingomonas sp.]
MAGSTEPDLILEANKLDFILARRTDKIRLMEALERTVIHNVEALAASTRIHVGSIFEDIAKEETISIFPNGNGEPDVLYLSILPHHVRRAGSQRSASFLDVKARVGLDMSVDAQAL